MVVSNWSEFRSPAKAGGEGGSASDSGEASWKKVVVAIIVDGIDAADRGVFE